LEPRDEARLEGLGRTGKAQAGTETAEEGRHRREVDSPDWERRRGKEPDGRRDRKSARWSHTERDAWTITDARSSKVDARPRTEPKPEGKPTGQRVAGRRQGPHRKVRRS
jgi:hypothetical protein